MFSASSPSAYAVKLPFVRSAACLLDLRASQIQGLSDGAPVSRWPDMSGQGHDFTQTGSARPTYHTGSGSPYVSFDDVDDYLQGPNFADDLPSFAIFYRGKLLTSAFITKAYRPVNTTGGWGVVTDSASRGFRLMDASGHYFIKGNIDLETFADTECNITAMLVSRAVAHLYVNGSNANETTSGGSVLLATHSSPESVRISGYANNSSFMAEGYIKSLLLYAPAPNNTDRIAIETWLATNP